MNYNFSSITSVAECDQMITDTVGDKLKTELMKFNSEGRVISDANAAVSMPSVVENLTTQLAAKQAQLAAATDPDEIEDLTMDVNSLENRLIMSNRRLENLSSSNIVKRQLGIGQLEFEILAFNEAIAALEARKAELIAQGA
jgi:capsule polysaccharide export protein KpsE/RkpR